MASILGCIGLGCMGSALMGGFAGKLANWKLAGYDRNDHKMKAIPGLEPAQGIAALAAASDILLLAVKPGQMPEVVEELRPALRPETMVISIAAGVGLAQLRMLLGKDCPLARCMPNTTARVGHGIFAFCFDEAGFPGPMRQKVLDMFGLLGVNVILREDRFGDFSAFMGAGPAYVFAVMQGLAQAGLTLGFPLAQSYPMLAELFAGCAELSRQQEKNFIALRDEVCSPGGLTIAGVNSLDRAGISGIMVDAVLAAAQRSREMEGGK